MAKTLHRLTVKQVENASPGTALNDGGGLFYRATTKGSGRWTFKFTSADPEYLAVQTVAAREKAVDAGRDPNTEPVLKQREMGLGAFPGTGLVRAREKATQARELVTRGTDPIAKAERDAVASRAAADAQAVAIKSNALTFGRYADEEFLPSVLPHFSNAAHIQQWRATFNTHAASLRDKVLADVTRADVLSVLEPIWTAKSVTASRCRERIERLFAHATQNGHFHRDNPAAWRQFDATLPPPRKLVRGHHAAVPHDNIAAFIAAVRAKQPVSTTALMLEWIALAACRTGEARFAVWSEIDLERNIWSVPAGRMKMRRDHVVPITGRMAEILAEARRRRALWSGSDEISPDEFVFANPDGKPLSEMSALMLMRRMRDFKDFTAHGLRATFKGWAATCTDFPRELIEEQLAHQLGAVERAYMRVSAVERRRPMMEAWAAHCVGEVPAEAAGNVVPLWTANGGEA